MDQRERKLLEAFAGSAAIAEVLDLAALGEPGEWLATADALVARGWLRRAGARTKYARTEEGRLALAGPLDVTFYTRPGCHLCEEAKAEIAPLLRRAGACLREVNIDADEQLRERYNVDVPVIFLGARKVAKHRVDREQFRRQLDEARRQPQRLES